MSRYAKERPPLFSEMFPDRARWGARANLIAGELAEARRRIPLADLRDSERVHWTLMMRGLEPLPRRRLRAHVAEHWGYYLAAAILIVPTLVAMLIFW